MAKSKKYKSTFASAFTKKSPLRKKDDWSKKLQELISPASNDTLHPTLQSMGKGMASYLIGGGMSAKEVVTFIEEADKARKKKDKDKE
jgi:uncharacterized radical SAM superfamily protein